MEPYHVFGIICFVLWGNYEELCAWNIASTTYKYAIPEDFSLRDICWHSTKRNGLAILRLDHNSWSSLTKWNRLKIFVRSHWFDIRQHKIMGKPAATFRGVSVDTYPTTNTYLLQDEC
jgi:hypothetical protein